MITPEDVRHVKFEHTRLFETGYRETDVDAFLDLVEEALRKVERHAQASRNTAPTPPPAEQWDPTLTPTDIRNASFSKPPFGMRGYSEDDVDLFLDDVEATIRQLRERLERYEQI